VNTRSGEFTDEEGTRVVLLDGRVSVYGKPSMTRSDGVIAIGFDAAPLIALLSADTEDAT
jgi:hypothetical protein